MIGRALSPVFDVDNLGDTLGSSVLKYFPEAMAHTISELQESEVQVQSGWQALVTRLWKFR